MHIKNYKTKRSACFSMDIMIIKHYTNKNKRLKIVVKIQSLIKRNIIISNIISLILIFLVIFVSSK